MVQQQTPSPGARLRELIHRKDHVLAVLHTPSAALARIMELSGCEAGFVGTSGVVGAYTGLADVGTATMTECVTIAGWIAQTVKFPVIMDGDTGHGGIMAVRRMVRECIRAGIAGVRIDDQPIEGKRRTQSAGVEVVPLEQAGARYRDVARESGRGAGVPAMLALLKGRGLARPPFAPPFLKAGRHIIGQTANILQFLGPRHALVPRDPSARLWVHQLQLTISDFVVEIHDTHHPIASGFYYEDQKKEARRRAEDFRQRRTPKYLVYFDGVIRKSGGPFLLGRRLGYPDLSLFQLVEGLRYAFPQMMRRLLRRKQSADDALGHRQQRIFETCARVTRVQQELRRASVRSEHGIARDRAIAEEKAVEIRLHLAG